MEATLRDVLAGPRGGTTRARIISALHERPRNVNQLADELDLHYGTVEYHLRLLTDAGVLVSSGGQYGAVYLPTQYVRDHWQTAEQLLTTALQSNEDDAHPQR